MGRIQSAEKGSQKSVTGRKGRWIKFREGVLEVVSEIIEEMGGGDYFAGALKQGYRVQTAAIYKITQQHKGMGGDTGIC